MREIPLTEARAKISDLAGAVRFNRERIALTRHGKPVAYLIGAEDMQRLEEAQSTTPNTYPTLRQLRAEDLSQHKAKALAGARRVLGYLESLGAKAAVVGSLARNRFRLHSDVDFLILSIPNNRRYTVEGQIEKLIGRDIPFHVLYLDEIEDPQWRARLLNEAKDGSTLV
ncbi:type II toxin-antitoxin system prevent-host-death family antitoxin [Geoalkalibacter halelectricus]|uniref:Antitoxin n=1 Tax=Geoalkalibacter halelectricus TaxID=2847045 RepID=A0ABY5ZKF0_9BACT|nr:type II toxin-antitoxin system prevent-host-death family antitoxin [Geoalkalibacter halelectricus]MDO3377166.1 type II toxin-antitoxin system prevent-host-death family antitoxin [Geoalkalibacter halelectricus]UWZ79620.1 type II toxin-antitoxin system prevent-host-death family antitoxin [Geoalkalibacter halelectricus]